MVKERRTELVEGFRHSVPYINAHRGKTFVIMLGGEAIEHENFSNIVNDIGLLHSLGIRLVVVYGARPQIDANLAEHHHEPVYHKQTRVTDAKTLELVKQAAGMLQRLLHIQQDEMPKFMDATDALGAAYCHFLQMNRPETDARHYSSWKDFATKNQSRIKK